MQKALVVRATIGDVEAQSCSYEVDATPATGMQTLRELLAQGWHVVHSCPMPSELDCCCLVIVEKGTPPPRAVTQQAANDVPIKVWAAEQAQWLPLPDTRGGDFGSPSPFDNLLARPKGSKSPHAGWDGESISLRSFGLDED